MAAPPQQQTTPNDHHYFEWSTTKQQKIVEQSLKVVPIGVNQQQLSTNNTNTNNSTNMVHNHPHLHNHPLMTHTHRRHFYQHFEEKRSLEDSKQKQNKTSTGLVPSTMNNSPNLSPSSTNCTTGGHVRKKQKTNTNGIGSASSTSSLNTSNDDHSQSQTCYPFQAELTQKIDIECGSSTNGSGQIAHTPTHHFTLSTVINVSVNGQTPQQQQQQQQQKSLDILSPLSSSLSQQQCPPTSSDQQDFLVHPTSSSPSVLSTSSPSTASPSTIAINSTNNNNNNNNSISNLISSTSPSTNLLSQSPSLLSSSSSLSSTSAPLIPFSELNFSSYIKDLDLLTFDTFILPSCPNPQDYLTIDGLLAFLNTTSTLFLLSDNNNNTLSIQKSVDYNKRYQQPQQPQMMTRSDPLTMRQTTPYLPNSSQQYPDAYRMQQPQQMYNYPTRPQQFEQPNRYYPQRYPSTMMTPYSSYPSYPYSSHNQVRSIFFAQ